MTEVPARVWFDPNTGRLQVTVTGEHARSTWDVKVVEIGIERGPDSRTVITIRPGRPTKTRERAPPARRGSPAPPRRQLHQLHLQVPASSSSRARPTAASPPIRSSTATTSPRASP